MSHPAIKIGISACLVGQPVRFNGGHKESRLCSETLAQHFELVPVCPEMAIGWVCRAKRSAWSATRRHRARSAAVVPNWT